MSKDNDEHMLVSSIGGIGRNLALAMCCANRGMTYEHLVEEAHGDFQDAVKYLKRIYDYQCEVHDNDASREEEERGQRAELRRQIDDLKQQLLERQ